MSWLCSSRCGRVYLALGTPSCTSSVHLRHSSRTVALRPQDLLRPDHRRTSVRSTWNRGEFRVLAENGLLNRAISLRDLELGPQTIPKGSVQ